jgi:hypothetical protein
MKSLMDSVEVWKDGKKVWLPEKKDEEVEDRVRSCQRRRCKRTKRSFAY